MREAPASSERCNVSNVNETRKMTVSKLAKGLLIGTAATILGGASSGAFAQKSDTWPSRPIRLIVPFPPGGGTDLVGRFYAEAYGLTTLTTRMFTHTGPRRGDVFAESTFAKQIAMIEAGLIELDPKYVDVIVRRFGEFSGQSAVLDGDGRGFGALAAERHGS